MKIYSLLFTCVLLVLGCKNESPRTLESSKDFTPTTEAEKIAYANGLENWKDVKQLDFTFKVDRGGQNVASRSWSWKPATNDVTMMSATDTISYNRATVDSISESADRGFVNDKYWLLAPYQLVWDEGTTVTVTDSVMSPITEIPSKKLTLLYGDEGGYTPGDAYDFYYNDDYVVSEWVFRKGNADQPSMTTTFEGYKNIEGLNISTEHKNADGSFRLYFTDVKVSK